MGEGESLDCTIDDAIPQLPLPAGHLPQAIKVSVAPSFQEIIDQLRALDAPKGDEPQIALFLSSTRQGTDTLLENASSAKALPDLETPV
jgi:hypothetical protein